MTQRPDDLRTSLTFGMLVAALMAVAATAGLFVHGVYRDNALVEASWRGNDLVSLVCAVPLLAGAILWTRRGSTRGLLLYLGMMAYAAYNHAFYLFGAAFNSLFLLYVGVLAFATLGLVFGLASTRLRGVAARVRVHPGDRWVGWLIILIALLLGLFWVGSSMSAAVTGRVPPMVVATDHPTNVTGALDLWLVVTFGLLGGIWLARRRPWGLVISVVWSVKGAVYMAALSAASVSAYVGGASEGLAQLGLWIPIGAACLLGALVLLRPGGSLPPDGDLPTGAPSLQ